jgi:hypothetical protein
MKEALKLALEALHGFIPYLPLADDDQCEKYDKAITAIEAALTQPAQEPVGVFCEDDDIGYVRLIPHQQMKLKAWDKLYTTPQQRLWVGLTHQEISNEVISDEPDFVQGFVQGARWADALLEDKNT